MEYYLSIKMKSQTKTRNKYWEDVWKNEPLYTFGRDANYFIHPLYKSVWSFLERARIEPNHS